MTSRIGLKLALTLAWIGVPGMFARAGREVAPAAGIPSPENVSETPQLVWFPESPRGGATFGFISSKHLTGGYIEPMSGLLTNPERNALLFIDSRYYREDDSQFVGSTGLGFRELLHDGRILLGANAFWDAIYSRNGKDYNQLGLGAEVLSEWIDFRINAAFPENNHYLVAERKAGDVVGETRSYEAALEGVNLEVGFKLPIPAKISEVRLFGGGYLYRNPFGDDFSGFQGRVEARLLRGVTADLEYWSSAALMGGHWIGELRVTFPFTSFFEIARGGNPFAFVSEAFQPLSGDFADRINEPIIRPERIETVVSPFRSGADHH